MGLASALRRVHVVQLRAHPARVHGRASRLRRVLTFLGLKLATQAHSGNMPGHLEMMVVIGVLIFQVSSRPRRAGLWEPEAAGGPGMSEEAAPDGAGVAA